MEALHGKDIYEGFDFGSYLDNPQGWGSDSPAFGKLIDELKPSFIIEVGTWKGGSAITMGKHLKRNDGGKILCIDTWLGAIEFWENQSDPERYQALRCHHGYPQVYFDFLANVCHAGLQNAVIPFPIHSASAALWLMRHGIKAKMIYIDASHEEDDVYQDLLDYHEIILPGGVLFGDDWAWAGVQSAVTRFAREQRKAISHLDDKWVIYF
jgi:Methyltransferase domain